MSSRDPRSIPAERSVVTMTDATLRLRSDRAMDVEPQALQHRLDRLLGERRVAQGVARALEAHDQAIADQLGVAGARRTEMSLMRAASTGAVEEE